MLWRVETSGAEILLPGQAVGFKEVGAEAQFTDLPTLSGVWRLETSRLEDLLPIRRFAPLVISGEGDLSAEGVAFDGAVSDDASLSLLALVTGEHNWITGGGQASISLGPVTLSRNELQPQRLLPALKGLIANVDGGVSGTSTLWWTSERVQGDASIRLDDFGFSSAAARIDGISGDVVFESLFPPATAPGLQLEVASVEAGIALVDGVVKFGLAAGGGVVIEEAAWPFAGGRISLSSGVIEPGEPEQEFELFVDKVDLSAFIQLLALEGASGTGVITGRIPIVVRDGDPIIVGGVLTADGPGQLSYKGEGTDAIGGGQGAIVFQALEDFRYSSLTLSLDGNAQDRLTVKLNLEGANPDLYDGYPFAINVNTEASFAELLRSATLGSNAIDLIRDNGATAQ